MADFNAHTSQASSNLAFLEKLNFIPDNWDWKVTVCFYVGVHIINAHLARVGDLHYQQHVEVDRAINFENILSPARLEENVFLAYRKLKNLSRRSRYLCLGVRDEDPKVVQITKAGDFIKALKQLDLLLDWFSKTYNYHFLQYNITCVAPKGDSPYFKVSSLSDIKKA